MSDSFLTGGENLIELRCSKCDTSVADAKSQNAVHCRNCKTKLIFRCLECKEVYDNRTSIMHHLSSPCKTWRYYCFICDFAATARKAVEDHLKTVHADIDLANYRSCAKCGRTLKNLALLKSHIQICRREPNFLCDHCPYKTKYKKDLSRHSQIYHSLSHIADKKLSAVESTGMISAVNYFVTLKRLQTQFFLTP